jgi:hypothetical protein
MKPKRKQINHMEDLLAEQRKLQTKQQELESVISNDLKVLKAALSPLNILRNALTGWMPGKINTLWRSILRKRR